MTFDAVLEGRAWGDSSPFHIQTQLVSGRPTQVLGAHFQPHNQGADLIAIVISDSPPVEKRRLVIFPAPWSAESAPPPITIDVPADIVAFDVGNVDDTPGDELVLLSATKLQILRPLAPPVSLAQRDTTPPLSQISFALPLPLPPRTRGLSRLAFLGDWNGLGAVEALLPTLSGAALLSLKDGARRDLPLPILADYDTMNTRTRAPDGFFGSSVTWPILMQADHNGDQRPDLFALSRFGVWIYHAGPNGLTHQPNHRSLLRLFSTTEELRPRATAVRLFAQDLDADGLADLTIHRTAGNLLSSRSATDIYRNHGNGIDLTASPHFALKTDDAFATIELVDLDSDGRTEILQAQFSFSIFQAIRVLTTRRAAIELRVLSLPDLQRSQPSPPHTSAHTSWSGDVALRLDFSQGRAEGLLPNAEGDWNGDRRRDLLYGLSREEIAIHLGTVGDKGPGFGSREATQTVPPASDSLLVDRNGDGLDDLVLFDPHDQQGAIHILLNRGVLPGTPPSLRTTTP